MTSEERIARLQRALRDPELAKYVDSFLDAGEGDKGEATAASAAVTLNKQSGLITSESLTTSSGSYYNLTLTNSRITSTSVVLVSVGNGTNTTVGLKLSAVTPGNGSAVIKILNDHANSALDGTLKIGFTVIN